MSIGHSQALERLCCQTAPSGFEGPVAQRRWSCSAPCGRGAGGPPAKPGRRASLRQARCDEKLLLDAHLDEIGLLVTGVEDGFLRFRSPGRWTTGCCPTGS